MSVVIRGRAIGVSRNGVFTTSNTDPIPGGKLWPEAALTWNAMRVAAVADGIEPWEFMPAGPRSSARDLPSQRFFFAHQPPPAAFPGTSNHGWAIAVDVLTKRAAAWLLKHAAKFGWSHDEGARVGEWWHFRYVGASKARLAAIKRGMDPLAGLTKTERRWVKEYDKLKRAKRDVRRRRALRNAMRNQMSAIRRAAEGEHNGWHKENRLKRYRTLKSRAV